MTSPASCGCEPQRIVGGCAICNGVPQAEHERRVRKPCRLCRCMLCGLRYNVRKHKACPSCRKL